MVTKRAQNNSSPFASADLSRQIIHSNKEKLHMAPVFLKDGLLSEIRDRQKRRRVLLRRWATWSSALGFGAFLFVVSLRQSGLNVPLSVPVALQIPVPNVNEQAVSYAEVRFSDGILAPVQPPGAQLGSKLKVNLSGKRVLSVPVLAQRTGSHILGVDFYRADGVLVAGRNLDIKTKNQEPKRPAVVKVTSTLHAFALLLRPTLFTTKVTSFDESIGVEFRASIQESQSH